MIRDAIIAILRFCSTVKLHRFYTISIPVKKLTRVFGVRTQIYGPKLYRVVIRYFSPQVLPCLAIDITYDYHLGRICGFIGLLFVDDERAFCY